MKIEKIKQLIKLVEESNINELEITTIFGRKIRIRKFNEDESSRAMIMPQSVVVSEVPSKAVEKAEPSEPAKVEEKLYEIKSPLVGTFYRSPRPDAPPFVNEGDHIAQGQVLCLIEAMKIFNEIKSEVSGTVVKIMVENGAAVQYGQVLFLVRLD